MIHCFFVDAAAEEANHTWMLFTDQGQFPLDTSNLSHVTKALD